MLDQMINLESLLIQLKPAANNKWYQLGEVLGVDKKQVLDKCVQYPSDQGLVEVLDNWLRYHTGQPTWREIAKALKEIGLQELALDLMNVYKTGSYSNSNFNFMHYYNQWISLSLILGKFPIEVAISNQLSPPPLPPAPRQT